MKIYLDHAATTQISEKVLSEMSTCFYDVYGNANSSHAFGRRAMAKVDNARDKIAEIINAQAKEIYFTSGGTEADNFALKGLYLANLGKKNKLIIGATEHHAILESAKTLQKLGCIVTVIQPEQDGSISPVKVEKEIDENTFLVSVMYVNNETGVINDIAEIGEICHKKGVLFHSDCVQATPCLSLDVKKLNLDLMTVSAHKIQGPKGIGFLYIKSGVVISPLIEGGAQELALRGGTTNVPAVVGMACAMQINKQTLDERVRKLNELQSHFEKGLKKIGGVTINGKKRVPSITSATFDGVGGMVVLTLLDLKGVAVSVGSACTAGSLDASTVLLSMGLSQEKALNTVRFSFGLENTLEELDAVLHYLAAIVEAERKKQA